MKTAIVYYSRTGNTRRIAELLAEQIEDVELVEVSTPKKLGFFKAARMASTSKGAVVENSDMDMAPYGLIIFGGPVWVGKTSPLLTEFIRTVKNVEGKKAVAFLSAGSPPDKNDQGVEQLETAITKKGMKCVGSAVIPMKKRRFIEEEGIDSILSLIKI